MTWSASGARWAVLKPCTSPLKMTRATNVATPPTARNLPASATTRCHRPPMGARLTGEECHRLADRLHHAVGERDADQGPGQGDARGHADASSRSVVRAGSWKRSAT